MSWKLLDAHRTPIRAMSIALVFFTKDARHWIAYSMPTDTYVLAIKVHQLYEQPHTVPEKINLEDVH